MRGKGINIEVGEAVHNDFGAECLSARKTFLAMAARVVQIAEADPITPMTVVVVSQYIFRSKEGEERHSLLQGEDSRTHVLHYAGAFMSEDLVYGSIVFICPAQTTVSDLQEDLIALQFVLVGG